MPRNKKVSYYLSASINIWIVTDLLVQHFSDKINKYLQGMFPGSTQLVKLRRFLARAITDINFISSRRGFGFNHIRVSSKDCERRRIVQTKVEKSVFVEFLTNNLNIKVPNSENLGIIT